MIVPAFAKFIIREHLRQPIVGNVLTLGRQTIGLTYEDALNLLHQEGCESVALTSVERENDNVTRGWKDYNFITDVTFFGLLGVTELSSMDVSNYEQATIIHNLNEPVPLSLYDKFDFILDGGTFDHLFDTRIAFENVVKMLKVGGRVLHIDAASNYIGQAYVLYTPELFYDYYTSNGFVNCRVWLAELGKMSQWENWKLYEFNGKCGRFQSKHLLVSLLIAEKDELSTYDKIPIQGQYQEQAKMGVVLPKLSFTEIVISRLKQKGLIWCIKRVLCNMVKYFNRKSMEGFVYLGKI